MRSLLSLTISLSGLLWGCHAPAKVTTSTNPRDANWQRDIAFVARELPARHKNAFHSQSRAEFQQAIDKLIKDVPTLRDYQIIVALKEIVANVGDKHTQLFTPNHSTWSGIFPIFIETLEDGVYVFAASSEYADAVGCRLRAIDTHDIKQVMAAMERIINNENQVQVRTDLKHNINVPDILHALGIIERRSEARFEFEKPSGERFGLNIKRLDEQQPEWAKVKFQGDLPLYAQGPAGAKYWYRYLDDSQSVYLNYNSCQEMEALPFARFVEDLFKDIENKAVRRFIIDLRLNGGGNSVIIDPLIEALVARSDLNQHGKLFVLIGSGTFSSAMLNAWQLRKKTEAILVGRPTGQKPNAYGEMRSFELPHSKLTVTYSTKYFKLVDDDAESLNPDIPVSFTFTDALHYRDPDLQTVLQLKH